MLATDLSEFFGRERIYQLPIKRGRAADFYTRAQVLFDGSATHDHLAARLEGGAEIAVVDSPAAAGRTNIRDCLGIGGIPMFVFTPAKQLHIVTAGDRLVLSTGQELIGLIDRGSRPAADPIPP
jgi:hypothetical protein